ncbi:hypothetical protein [Cellvibrio sp. pealriver]|uniref:hypothetical protein n=1 Tax=Cellvibrio sp. pealriver TaxID=1622269 RepID=UPI00066FEC28|nr:hypothetical protein [Cellvibrio sp. pealriver]
MRAKGFYSALLALAASAPVFVSADDEPEPVYADVQMDSLPYEGENCEGGDWSLNWKGPVYVENGPLADLLISYTAFDTSHQGQRAIPSVKFQSNKVTCRDNDGKVIMTANVSQKNSNKVQLTVSLAQDAAYNSPAFIFSADEMGVCRVNSAGTSFEYPNVMASIHTGMLNAISPALDITLEDLQKGFNKTYKFDGTVVGIAPMCMGSQLKTGSVNLRYKSGAEDPEVAFNACLHLAKDETREVSAEGSPENGNYQFTASPADVLAITRQQKNSATIQGKTPGKGEVTVDYTVKGKTASATIAGSVVELVNINNGSAIPKLGIYDEHGKQIRTFYSFPLTLNPVDGFVQMTLANDTIASVTNTATSIQIQPVKTGKTLLQAKTLCGSDIGEPTAIEIVRCDDEVQEKLRTKKEEYKQRTDTIVKRITGLTGDSEFQRAATEIADTTKDMAIKTGESIINTLSFGEAQQAKFAASKGIHLSQQIVINNQRLEVAGTLWDSYNAVGDAQTAFANPDDMTAQAKFYIGTAVLVAQNQAIALGKTYGEAYLAAEKFGKDLGILAGVADQLAELEPQHSKLIKEYIQISDRLAYCEKTPPPKEDQPLPPQPEESEPQVEEVPPEEIPVTQEPEEESEPDQEPEEEPTPPSEETPKKTYGLACRIQDLKAPGTAQKLRELKQLHAAHLQSLKTAKTTLATWQSALEKMKVANEGTDAQRAAAFPQFQQEYEQFLLKSAQQGFDSLEFLQETEECPDRLQIKMDQVRARYN